MAKSLITVTSRVLEQFRRVIRSSGCASIRLSLKSGGCNGFEYRLEPTNDKLTRKEELYSKEGVDIQICASSAMYILGTEIDWKRDVMGETFTFSNPSTQSTCGCGSSFNPKV